MVDTPLRISVEESRRRMDIDWSSLDKCLVSLLRILLRSVSEVARADGSADTVVILAGGDDIMFIPMKLSAKASDYHPL